MLGLGSVSDFRILPHRHKRSNLSWRFGWKTRVYRLALVAALVNPWWMHAAVGAANGGYAVLVRQAAPSVVTVLVKEEREGAGQRAVERATADQRAAGAIKNEKRIRLLPLPGLQTGRNPGVCIGTSVGRMAPREPAAHFLGRFQRRRAQVIGIRRAGSPQ